MTNNPDKWFQTYTGVEFVLPDFKVECINIEDIAHSLSLQCRFNGHIKEFYSVAQHSVLVAHNVPMKNTLWGLLHDAAEAYLSDLPAPMKSFLPEYRTMEEALMRRVCEKFGLSTEMPSSVRRVDLRMLATEKRDFVASPEPRVWDSLVGVEPYPETIEPMSPRMAEQEFLRLFQYAVEYNKIALPTEEK